MQGVQCIIWGGELGQRWELISLLSDLVEPQWDRHKSVVTAAVLTACLVYVACYTLMVPVSISFSRWAVSCILAAGLTHWGCV